MAKYFSSVLDGRVTGRDLYEARLRREQEKRDRRSQVGDRFFGLAQDFGNKMFDIQNREDEQTFQTGERVGAEAFRKSEREAGQDWRRDVEFPAEEDRLKKLNEYNREMARLEASLRTNGEKEGEKFDPYGAFMDSLAVVALNMGLDLNQRTGNFIGDGIDWASPDFQEDVRKAIGSAIRMVPAEYQAEVQLMMEDWLSFRIQDPIGGGDPKTIETEESRWRTFFRNLLSPERSDTGGAYGAPYTGGGVTRASQAPAEHRETIEGRGWAYKLPLPDGIPEGSSEEKLWRALKQIPFNEAVKRNPATQSVQAEVDAIARTIEDGVTIEEFDAIRAFLKRNGWSEGQIEAMKPRFGIPGASAAPVEHSTGLTY